MDFQPKTANLQGGDTRETPNLANTQEDWFSLLNPSKSARRQAPPPRQLHAFSISRHLTSIC